MTDHLLTGLVKRRADAAGEAEAIRSRLLQLDVDLVYLDAVIRQIDPDDNPAGIRPKRLVGPDVAHRGEHSRLLSKVMREAGKSLGTAEILRRMLLRLGQHGDDRKVARESTKRTEAALSRQERVGVIRSVRDPGHFVLWEVAR